MKIAIQLAGQLRDWDNQKEFFIHIKNLKPNNIEVLDFFLATWDDGIDVDKTFFKKVHFKQPIDNISIYKMADRWEKVTKLRNDYEEETGIEYDVVLHTRPDAIFTNPFKTIEKIKEVEDKRHIRINPRTVFVPNGLVIHKKKMFDLSNQTYYSMNDKPDHYIFTDDHLFMGHPLSIDVLGTFLNALRRKVISSLTHVCLAEWFITQRQIVYDIPIYTELSRNQNWKEFQVRYKEYN